MNAQQKLQPNQDAPETLFNAMQVDTLIRQTEKELTAALQLQNEREPDYRAAETMYNVEKEKFESAAAVVTDLRGVLVALARYRGKVKSNQQLRVLRTTSHTDKPVKEKSQIPWTKYAIEQLTRMDRFCDPQRLYEIIIQENNLHNVGKHTQYKTLDNWRKRAVNANNVLCIYQNRIGLRAWVNDEGQPVGNYLALFTHKI